MNKVIYGAAVAVAALALTGCSSAISGAGESCSGTKPLHAFFDELDATESPQPDSDSSDVEGTSEFDDLFDDVVVVEDDGQTLIINTKPDDDDPLGVTSLALECVYEQLDVPSHVSERIGATRAMDGRQDAAWDGYTASWSYHPDSGANVIIVKD